jgi:DNA-binding SARP family transcriptional activator
MGQSQAQLEFVVLGPLAVYRDGAALHIATRRQRALLMLLLLNVGRPVPADRLIDQLWDGSPPPQAAVTLRSYVSNLRQALGGRDGGGAALATRGQGYVLDVPPGAVDASRFRALVEEGRAKLRVGAAAEALSAFQAAEDLWLGDPYAEIADHEVVQGVRAQLTEIHLAAVEGRFEALLVSGRHLDATPELESFVADHPLREAPRAQLMLALYRGGRAAEALEVHRRFRDLLADELGIDPSAALDSLQQKILQQAPDLDAPPVTGPSAASADNPGTAPPRPVSPRDGHLPTVRTVVGRERELGELTRRLDALGSARAGGLVLIGGEAGIGKTTLLDVVDALARDRSVRTHAGRSPSAGGAPAFWPWTQVLTSLAAGMDDEELTGAAQGNARLVSHLSGSIAERLGQTLPPTGDNAAGLRFLLYQAVSDFLRAAATSPHVVLLDDLHWADLPSLELLSYLTPALVEMPVLVVAAYRDVVSERSAELADTLATVSREDAVQEISLGGLDEAAVRDLARLALSPDESSSIGQEMISLLHHRTGGNPFFVSQLARTLVDDDAARSAGGPIPPGIRHVIDSRLRSLARSELAVLETAALVGQEFDVRVVSRAAGVPLEEALDAYDRAGEHGLVELGDATTGHRFVHALVQEVVAHRVPLGRSAKIHAGIALQLERVAAPVDQVAEHMWLGRDLLGTRGLPHLLSAADSAAAVFAHERAELFLRRALAVAQGATPPDPATELHVLLALFRLLATARGWGATEAHEVVARARALIEVTGWSEDTLHLWWSLFFFLIDRDDEPAYSEVARTLLASVNAADSSDSAAGDGRLPGHAAHAAVHLMSIFSSLALDDRHAAEAHLRAARSHVEAAPYAELAAFDEHLHVMLLLIEGYWSALTGDAAGNRATTQAAIALADADGRPFPRAVARTLGASSAPYVDDGAFVLEVSAQALELDRRFGFEWLATVAATLHTWADARVNGPGPRGGEAIEERLDELGATGRHGTASLLLVLLADVHALQGDTGKARECLMRARQAPGPYRGLVVDLIDRRLEQLDQH